MKVTVRRILTGIWPSGLAARMTLLVSCTAGLSVLIAVFSMVLLGWRAAESRALAAGREDARALAFSLAAPLAFEDAAGAREVLDLLSHRSDVLSVWVRNAEGLLLHSAGTTRAPPVTDGGGLSTGELVISAPVLAGRAAEELGSVTLRIDLDGARQELRWQVLAACLAAFAALAVTVLLARQMARRMSVPVVRLAEAAAALTRDWSHPQRLTGSGPGEIGVALEAFNHMVDELTHRDEALRKLTGELRDAAAAAEAARQQAESASLAKTRFLANMSHELRSPLNGVIGAAQLLQKSDRDPAFRAELIRVIQASGTNLLDLIEGVLDVSRIEAGGVKTEQEPFDLMHCMEAALAPAVASAAVKRLALDFHVDADVPAWVVGDAARVKQLLQNLLGNAVKFSDAGTISLGVSRDAQDGFVCFHVTDTGVGIPPHLLETIFEPFQQGDPSATRRFGGSGLGLTICREVARLMHGDVQVESSPGMGSRFTLRLPLPAAQHAPAAPRLDGLTVHCHEPVPARRASLTALLARLGCRARFHDNPGAAHAAMARARTQGVVSGCWLIATDAPHGEAVLQAVRAAGHHRVAALCSAPVDADVAVLSRPLTLSALHAFLETPRAGRGEAAPGTVRQRMLRARVLLVEDDPVNRLVVRAMIDGSEFECTVAEGGAMALQVLRSERFDAVLMDWQMPDMDGLEVTRRLRAGGCGELNRAVPVIALTANAFAEDRNACLAAGMNDFLTKPVQSQQLLQCVQRWCRLPVEGEGKPEVQPALSAATPAPAPSPAAGSPGASAYDATVLAALSPGTAGGDEVREVLDMFCANATATLDAMDAAAARQDWPALQRKAHSIKGSAGQVGAMAMSAVAAALEQRLRSGGCSRPADLTRLRETLREFVTAAGLPVPTPADTAQQATLRRA